MQASRLCFGSAGKQAALWECRQESCALGVQASRLCFGSAGRQAVLKECRQAGCALGVQAGRQDLQAQRQSTNRPHFGVRVMGSLHRGGSQGAPFHCGAGARLHWAAARLSHLHTREGATEVGKLGFGGPCVLLDLMDHFMADPNPLGFALFVSSLQHCLFRGRRR